MIQLPHFLSIYDHFVFLMSDLVCHARQIPKLFRLEALVSICVSSLINKAAQIMKILLLHGELYHAAIT